MSLNSPIVSSQKISSLINSVSDDTFNGDYSNAVKKARYILEHVHLADEELLLHFIDQLIDLNMIMEADKILSISGLELLKICSYKYIINTKLGHRYSSLNYYISDLEQRKSMSIDSDVSIEKSLAQLYFEMSDFKRSAELFTTTLFYSKSKLESQKLLLSCALAHYRAGDFEKGMELNKKANALSKNSFFEAVSKLYKLIGDYEQDQLKTSENLIIIQQIKNPIITSENLYLQGWFFLLSGVMVNSYASLEVSRIFFQRARKIEEYYEVNFWINKLYPEATDIFARLSLYLLPVRNHYKKIFGNDAIENNLENLTPLQSSIIPFDYYSSHDCIIIENDNLAMNLYSVVDFTSHVLDLYSGHMINNYHFSILSELQTNLLIVLLSGQNYGFNEYQLIDLLPWDERMSNEQKIRNIKKAISSLGEKSISIIKKKDLYYIKLKKDFRIILPRKLQTNGIFCYVTKKLNEITIKDLTKVLNIDQFSADKLLCTWEKQKMIKKMTTLEKWFIL